jgi:hypothetical protein
MPINASLRSAGLRLGLIHGSQDLPALDAIAHVRRHLRHHPADLERQVRFGFLVQRARSVNAPGEWVVADSSEVHAHSVFGRSIRGLCRLDPAAASSRNAGENQQTGHQSSIRSA